jgi:aspartate aminotransferase
MDNEYLPVEGLQSFIDGSIKLAYGPELYAANIARTAGVQVLSGTGAIRLGFEFMARYLPAGTAVYIPNPTWPNHVNIARDAHFTQKEYRYFDPSTKGVQFNGFMEDLHAMPTGSVVLLHACAHNPTGCDLTPDQWK